MLGIFRLVSIQWFYLILVLGKCSRRRTSNESWVQADHSLKGNIDLDKKVNRPPELSIIK